jgi:hypothetical protein
MIQERLARVGLPQSDGLDLTTLVISAVSSRTRYPSPSPTRSVVASERGTCFSHLHLPSKLVVPIFPPPIVTTDPNLGVRTLLHPVAISQQLLLFIPLSHIAPTLVLHCCDWSVASVFRSREFRGGGGRSKFLSLNAC